MRKIITCGLLAAAALSAATPALADDSTSGGGVNAASGWNFSSVATCLQEVAVVPALGDWAGDHKNNCSTGNVIDKAAGALPLGR